MNNSKSITEQFLDKYKQMELEIHQKYGEILKTRNDSAVLFLENRPEYGIYKNGIHWCREIRNLLSHNSKVKEKYPITPSPQMIDFMDEVIDKVRSRKTCLHVGVPLSKMYCRSIGDNVMETIRKMRSESFTYIPIVDGRKVIGVFDENSLFCYVADNEIVDLDGLTFENIKDYLSLDGREMEVFTFHSKRTYLDELREEFQRQFEHNKRVGVVFITENGKRGEAITHMLTAWDVIGLAE